MTRLRTSSWKFGSLVGQGLLAACLGAGQLMPPLVQGSFAQEAAPGSDYHPVEPGVVQVVLDSHPTESFLSVRVDSLGRVFCGGREALFVYEPSENGSYGPRKELYRFPAHTWVYDIALRGHDVYLLTTSALYLLKDAANPSGPPEQIEPKLLFWGVPMGHVHQCFHSLAWGPEGDLYISMGDPVWYYGDYSRADHWGHWTFYCQPHEMRVPYTGVGGVFRLKPDGTHFQVMSRGLRNSCGLCFDSDWNLFSNDNDHEGVPADYVPGRLNHVTPYSYFSWPRGWLLSKTPDRMDLLASMTYDLGRAVPVGQAYYDEALFPQFRNNLLVARWGIRAVTRYPLERAGSSFTVKEHHILDGQNHARPVGVAVGRGGAIFVTMAFMAHNEGSPVYPSDLVMLTADSATPGDASAGPNSWQAYDSTQATAQVLFSELNQSDWARRDTAHQEILRRGGQLLANAAAQLPDAGISEPQLGHLVWLAAASGLPQSAAELRELGALSQNARLRTLAVRALAEFKNLQPEGGYFSDRLSDEEPQVRHAALVGLMHRTGPADQRVVDGPARENDTYLRQLAAFYLAARMSPDALSPLCASDDEPTRLAGVLAAGFKLTVPATGIDIPDTLPLTQLRSPDDYQIQLADRKVDLRERPGRIGNFSVADHWHAGEHSADQEALFELLLARLKDESSRVRLQAAHFLYLLNDPRSEPGVNEVQVRGERERLAVAPVAGLGQVWIAGPFPDMGQGFATAHPPEQAAIDLTAVYKTTTGDSGWTTRDLGGFLDFEEVYSKRPALNDCSVYALFRLDCAKKQQAEILVGSDDGIRVWQNGRLVHDVDLNRGALPLQDRVPVTLEPGSNDFLVRVRNQDGAAGLYVHFRHLGEVVAQLPEAIGPNELAARLAEAAQAGEQPIAADFLNVDWVQAAAEGDAQNGRQLFDKIGCIKCHAVDAAGPANGAPSLQDAKARLTVSHLVESILLPNKQVSPVFRATAIETTGGQQLIGLVIGETGDALELVETNGTKTKVPKTEIATRELRDQSPMPQGVVKTPAELKDLLAFLLGGQTPAPSGQ